MSILSPLEPASGGLADRPAVATGRPLVPDALRPPAQGRGAPAALPLPPVGWGAPQALLALEEARAALPPLAAEPHLVSALSTVVLRSGDQAVKVYPPGTDAPHLDRLRTALAGVRSVVTWSIAPVVTPYGVVTLMPWVDEVAELDWPAMGTLLRRFHDETHAVEVPDWTPLSRLEAQVADLTIDDAAVLLGARAELLAALDGCRSELGIGVLHGDVSLGNAVGSREGPLLIDPDWVARGPREYDLAAAARRRARGELDRGTYRRFCAAYGHDVRGWSGLSVLDRVAELGALAFALWDCRRQGQDLEWCGAAVRAWRVAL